MHAGPAPAARRAPRRASGRASYPDCDEQLISGPQFNTGREEHAPAGPAPPACQPRRRANGGSLYPSIIFGTLPLTLLSVQESARLQALDRQRTCRVAEPVPDAKTMTSKALSVDPYSSADGPGARLQALDRQQTRGVAEPAAPHGLVVHRLDGQEQQRDAVDAQRVIARGARDAGDHVI